MAPPPRRHGLLLIDKPSGLTSHDVVDRIRRAAGQRRVGHSGTLDPMATGLMVLLLGAATRLEPYLAGLDKRYSGRLRLGLTTDTDDLAGRQLEVRDGPWPDLEALRAGLKAREGEGEQRPPAFSAVKIAGRRAYQRARAGEKVEPPPRLVTAYGLELTAWQPPEVSFTAWVSSGYYIRSLARDLGRDLELGGALTALRREAVGSWTVARAATLEQAAAWTEEDWTANLIPPAESLPHLPAVRLDETEAADFGQGRRVSRDREGAPGPHKVLGPDGGLLGLGEFVSPFPPSLGGGPPQRPFLRPLRVLHFG